MEFEQEYYCSFPTETKAEKQLRKLAREYHERTEAHDQVYCTKRTTQGVAMPANSQEATIINQYAIQLHKELGMQAATLGFNAKQWHEAIKSASNARYNY